MQTNPATSVLTSGVVGVKARCASTILWDDQTVDKAMPSQTIWWVMKRLPAAGAASAVFLSLGLALMVSTRAAADPSFADGAIHCTDGKVIPWSADRAPPSESEQRFDCALAPRTEGAPSSETSVPALTGLAGSNIDGIIAQHDHERVERERSAEAAEHQHLLAGKFGEWAAFNAALKDGRSDIWARILGKWTGVLMVVCGALWLLLRRKR